MSEILGNKSCQPVPLAPATTTHTTGARTFRRQCAVAAVRRGSLTLYQP